MMGEHQHPANTTTRQQRYEPTETTYPADNNLLELERRHCQDNSPRESRWELPDLDDDYDRGRTGRFFVGLAAAATTLGHVGNVGLLPTTTTASASKTVEETTNVAADGKAATRTTFDLTNQQNDSTDTSHLLDTRAARLLPIARVCPIQPSAFADAAAAAAANGCPALIWVQQAQNDLLFSSPARPATDTITAATLKPESGSSPGYHIEDNNKQQQDQLDLLAEKYLSQYDKLNLSYYLNEYQTNACDLSELLANLIHNLLTKLPNPMIKYKLLSYIKELYIDGDDDDDDADDDSGGDGSSFEKSIERSDDSSRAGDKNPQLDLLLFDTMIHQYLIASNALMSIPSVPCSSELIRLQHSSMAERKRKRRQCRAIRLANNQQQQQQQQQRRREKPKQLITSRPSSAVPCGRRETSRSSSRRRHQLRNLAEQAPNNADRLNLQESPHEWRRPADNWAPLDYCCGQVEFDQVVASSLPSSLADVQSPSSSSGPDNHKAPLPDTSSSSCHLNDALATPAVVGQLPERLPMDSVHGSLMDSTWHERNLLSASVVSAGAAWPAPPFLASQNIYPPSGSAALFAKYQSNYHRQDQQQPSLIFHQAASPRMSRQRRRHVQISGQPRSANNSPSPLILANDNQQPSSASHYSAPPPLPFPNQWPRGTSSIGYRDRQIQAASNWPSSASLELPSGRPYHRSHHFDTIDQQLGVEREASEEDDDPVSSIPSYHYDYETLLNDDDDDDDDDGDDVQTFRPTEPERSTEEYYWPGPAVSGANERHPPSSELFLPPRQQTCQCDQCLLYAPLSGPDQQQQQQHHQIWRPADHNEPLYQQHLLFGQRSASVQNYQPAGCPFLAANSHEQRCFSSMSVPYEGQQPIFDQPETTTATTTTMIMTPSQVGMSQQRQHQQFVNSPPAGCCDTQAGFGRAQASPFNQQQQRLAYGATHSSLPSSPVSHRNYYLQAAGGMTPLPAGPDGRQNFSDRPHHLQQQQQRRRHHHHHQSIQLKDWPAGSSLVGAAQLPSVDSRRQQTASHQSIGAATARSATINDNNNNNNINNNRHFGPASYSSQQHRDYAGRRREQQEGDLNREKDDDDDEEDDDELEDEFSGDECALVPLQAKGKLPLSVAEQMERQASNFVNQYGSANSRRSRKLPDGRGTSCRQTQAKSKKKNLLVRRTLRVKIKKSKPILGIAIEGGFNVSGQLLPRVVCVHEDGAAYQCGKLRASDLILEVNGNSTVNMTHDQIAKTIATAYYQDQRPYIEFLIGESVQA